MIPQPQKIKDPAKYADFDLPREKLEYALAEALKKIDIGVATFTPESNARTSGSRPTFPTKITLLIISYLL